MHFPYAQTSESFASSDRYPDKTNKLTHALLMNLQSRVVRIPLFVLYTTGNGSLSLFGQPSPYSEYLYRPPSIKETELIE